MESLISSVDFWVRMSRGQREPLGPCFSARTHKGSPCAAEAPDKRQQGRIKQPANNNPASVQLPGERRATTRYDARLPVWVQPCYRHRWPFPRNISIQPRPGPFYGTGPRQKVRRQIKLSCSSPLVLINTDLSLSLFFFFCVNRAQGQKTKKKEMWGEKKRRNRVVVFFFFNGFVGCRGFWLRK